MLHGIFTSYKETQVEDKQWLTHLVHGGQIHSLSEEIPTSFRPTTYSSTEYRVRLKEFS